MVLFFVELRSLQHIGMNEDVTIGEQLVSVFGDESHPQCRTALNQDFEGNCSIGRQSKMLVQPAVVGMLDPHADEIDLGLFNVELGKRHHRESVGIGFENRRRTVQLLRPRPMSARRAD